MKERRDGGRERKREVVGGGEVHSNPSAFV